MNGMEINYFISVSSGPLEQERKWLKKGSPAFESVKTIIENKRTLADLDYLVRFFHTGNLEVYHSVVNKYCPKETSFFFIGDDCSHSTCSS